MANLKIFRVNFWPVLIVLYSPLPNIDDKSASHFLIGRMYLVLVSDWLIPTDLVLGANVIIIKSLGVEQFLAAPEPGPICPL